MSGGTSAEDEVGQLAGFVAPLLGLPVSRAWQGHGAALFLEFGALTPGVTLRDGSPCDPVGAFGLMIDSSWRIEGRRSILCGRDMNAAR